MERRKFTREFKLEAVRLIKDRGVSYTQASVDLGVHPSQLRNWVKKFSDDPQHAFRGMFSKAGDGLIKSPIAPQQGTARAPKQGEHTEAVLGEAGLTPAEIDALRKAGATR